VIGRVCLLVGWFICLWRLLWFQRSKSRSKPLPLVIARPWFKISSPYLAIQVNDKIQDVCLAEVCTLWALSSYGTVNRQIHSPYSCIIGMTSESHENGTIHVEWLRLIGVGDGVREDTSHHHFKKSGKIFFIQLSCKITDFC